MSPYLPFKPEDMVQQAVDAASAGAAILHVHARDPQNGKPTQAPEAFLQFLPQIKAATNAVINITTGGGTRMTLEERIAPALRLKPEMASFNMGSMNFATYPMARKHKDWRFDWEKEYLEGTDDVIFRNTFRDMKTILRDVGQGCGTRFEFECYDLGHLYNLAHLLDEGLVKPPLFVQTIFGILGGMGPDPENLMHVRTTANRLFGRDGYFWSILGAGRHQMNLLTIGAIMGGNVRVGLEDSLYLGKGQLAKSSAEQVQKIRWILNELSLEIATPEDVRGMLSLKGASRVAF